MKIVDFTDIDLYPKRYWRSVKGGTERFILRSLIIEDIDRQGAFLIAKKTHLMVDDAIRVDFKFGHNMAKRGEGEKWVDVRVSGVYRVLKIIPWGERSEIELVVRWVD